MKVILVAPVRAEGDDYLCTYVESIEYNKVKVSSYVGNNGSKVGVCIKDHKATEGTELFIRETMVEK